MHDEVALSRLLPFWSRRKGNYMLIFVLDRGIGRFWHLILLRDSSGFGEISDSKSIWKNMNAQSEKMTI